MLHSTARDRTRTAVLGAIFIALWLCLVLGDHLGLRYLALAGDLDRGALPPLLGPSLAGLLAFLATSDLLLAHALLFRNEDLPLVMTLPLPSASLCAARLLSVTFWGSWSLVLVGAPVALSLGAVLDAPPGYYLLLAASALPLLVLPAALGSLGALGIGWLAPRAGRLGVLTLGSTALGLVAAAAVAGGCPLPSDRLAAALGAALQGQATAVAPACLGLWGLAALATAVFLTAGASLHRRALQDQADRAGGPEGQLAPLARGGALEGWALLLLARATPATRAHAIKDLRGFLRDPGQWSHAGFLGLLLVVYLAVNLAWEGPGPPPAVVSLRYVAAAVTVCLVTGVFTTRFVFPLPAMEGPSIWALATTPDGRRGLVERKFALGLAPTLALALATSLASSLALRATAVDAAWAALMAAITGTGLCGLASGLGARFPTFEEPSPARIVNGVGGTTCFFFSSVYALTAAVLHVPLALPGGGPLRPLAMGALLLVHLALSTLAVALSLAEGRRGLAAREF